ncbi:hypothetical protein Sar04_24850 [Salinispora arenicola]|uniref:Uncharacterized protein n=1 Tax=Salinispora arenicola TaxID=168697 RepID=A0ABQ4JV61_SALAC|nr:hypothetical protein Sar04_24850 [Salinispora arenicola]
MVYPRLVRYIPIGREFYPTYSSIDVLSVAGSARPTSRFPPLARRLTDVRDYSDATMPGAADRANTRHRPGGWGEVTV